MLCVSSEREFALSLKHACDLCVAWHFVETQREDDYPVGVAFFPRTLRLPSMSPTWDDWRRVHSVKRELTQSQRGSSEWKVDFYKIPIIQNTRENVQFWN